MLSAAARHPWDWSGGKREGKQQREAKSSRYRLSLRSREVPLSFRLLLRASSSPPLSMTGYCFLAGPLESSTSAKWYHRLGLKVTFADERPKSRWVIESRGFSLVPYGYFVAGGLSLPHHPIRPVEAGGQLCSDAFDGVAQCVRLKEHVVPRLILWAGLPV